MLGEAPNKFQDPVEAIKTLRVSIGWAAVIVGVSRAKLFVTSRPLLATWLLV